MAAPPAKTVYVTPQGLPCDAQGRLLPRAEAEAQLKLVQAAQASGIASNGPPANPSNPPANGGGANGGGNMYPAIGRGNGGGGNPPSGGGGGGGGKWNCPACTYENLPTISSCVICQAKRPAKGSSGSGGGGGGGGGSAYNPAYADRKQPTMAMNPSANAGVQPAYAPGSNPYASPQSGGGDASVSRQNRSGSVESDALAQQMWKQQQMQLQAAAAAQANGGQQPLYYVDANGRPIPMAGVNVQPEPVAQPTPAPQPKATPAPAAVPTPAANTFVPSVLMSHAAAAATAAAAAAAAAQPSPAPQIFTDVHGQSFYVDPATGRAVPCAPATATIKPQPQVAAAPIPAPAPVPVPSAAVNVAAEQFQKGNSATATIRPTPAMAASAVGVPIGSADGYVTYVDANGAIIRLPANAQLMPVGGAGTPPIPAVAATPAAVQQPTPAPTPALVAAPISNPRANSISTPKLVCGASPRCTWTGPSASARVAHEAKCEFVGIECPYSEFGCHEHFERTQIPEHCASAVSSHLDLVVVRVRALQAQLSSIAVTTRLLTDPTVIRHLSALAAEPVVGGAPRVGRTRNTTDVTEQIAVPTAGGPLDFMSSPNTTATAATAAVPAPQPQPRATPTPVSANANRVVHPIIASGHKEEPVPASKSSARSAAAPVQQPQPQAHALAAPLMYGQPMSAQSTPPATRSGGGAGPDRLQLDVEGALMGMTITTPAHVQAAAAASAAADAAAAFQPQANVYQPQPQQQPQPQPQPQVQPQYYQSAPAPAPVATPIIASAAPSVEAPPAPAPDAFSPLYSSVAATAAAVMSGRSAAATPAAVNPTPTPTPTPVSIPPPRAVPVPIPQRAVPPQSPGRAEGEGESHQMVTPIISAALPASAAAQPLYYQQQQSKAAAAATVTPLLKAASGAGDDHSNNGNGAAAVDVKSNPQLISAADAIARAVVSSGAPIVAAPALSIKGCTVDWKFTFSADGAKEGQIQAVSGMSVRYPRNAKGGAAAGQLFVADSQNSRVSVFSTENGMHQFSFGTSGKGTLAGPSGLAIDDDSDDGDALSADAGADGDDGTGLVYVSDQLQNRIVVFRPDDGRFVRAWPFNGRRARGAQDGGEENGGTPSAAAPAPAGGVAENDGLLSSAPGGASEGGAGAADAETGRGPYDIALYGEEVYAPDWDDGVIRVFDKRTGRQTRQFGTGKLQPEELSRISIDRATGEVYVVSATDSATPSSAAAAAAVHVFRASDGVWLRSLPRQIETREPAVALAVTGDECFLACLNSIVVVDRVSGKTIRKLHAPRAKWSTPMSFVLDVRPPPAKKGQTEPVPRLFMAGELHRIYCYALKPL